MGSQVLPGNLLWHGTLPPWVCSSLPGACSGTVCPQVDSLLSGTALPWPGLLQEPQGHRGFTTAFIMGCGESWSCLSFPTAPGVCRAVPLTCSLLSPLSSLAAITSAQQLLFFLFLNMLSKKYNTITNGFSLIQQQIHPAGNGSARHGGSLQHHLTKATPAAPPLPKPGCANPLS